MTPAMPLSWAVCTDAGRRRTSNEDSHSTRPDVGLFIVADGMGGHVAGEVASRLAVATIEHLMSGPAAANGQAGEGGRDAADGARSGELLATAFAQANARLADEMESTSALRGMATTASALLVGADGTATLAHVGDSRIYRLRQGQFERLTTDHSWVEEQVRAGLLDRSSAQQHPWRNVVTRAISGTADLQVDLGTVPLAAGDVFVLCSDGLSSVVIDERMARAVHMPPDLGSLCPGLVDLANDEGGPDNITVVAVRIDVA
jgi:protein phosphatase